ncbi:MAG: hypothetical protein KBD53_00040 [Candidatus Omnitrophica bacterium]|nr:hypothetical protein [Candidatus Omnitrophota bacterium]
MSTPHTFHVPVMGTAFSIDTPIKVAHYGISSVISLVDDTLIEQMRQFYCQKYGEQYEPITKYDEDFRARRITAYLNLIDKIVNQKFEAVRNSCFEMGSEITKYFEMLGNNSPLKKLYKEMLATENASLKMELQARLRQLMKPGSIDVNIMTKLDRANFSQKREELSIEFSDALSALRGYALSTVSSAIVFSAGINRRLYSYVEKFEGFFADTKGKIKKKIILKVSDYRSSIIQGKFFAKKGLWISEFRIESGLNCGGHAFASDGFLMGPILEEFKKKKDELVQILHQTCNEALQANQKPLFSSPHEMRITAQGGIGTALEDSFLLNYYDLDGTGWASPFLLCPEVTNVDLETLDKLAKAGEADLYLSNVSPLGVPFNNLRDSQSDAERNRKIASGKPGSACPKGHLVSNTEFTEKPICTASRQYQKLKIEQLEKSNLPEHEFKRQFNTVTDKACICHDLGSSVLVKNDILKQGVSFFTAVCPGPNIAYFSKIVTLEEMIGHIYGRLNLLNSTYRSNMFINELKMYVDYFIKEVHKTFPQPTEKQTAYLNEFKNNMLDGVEYYRGLFPKMVEETKSYRDRTLKELEEFNQKILIFVGQYPTIFNTAQNTIPA